MTQYSVVDMTAQPFAYISRKAATPDIASTMQQGFVTLMTALDTAGAAPTGMPFCHYLDYDDNATTFELGFPVAPDNTEAVKAAGLEVGETVSGQVMHGTHIGSYDSLPGTYNRIMEAMAAQNLSPARDMWEAYCSPPETPPENTRTEVYWPVAG